LFWQAFYDLGGVFRLEMSPFVPLSINNTAAVTRGAILSAVIFGVVPLSRLVARIARGLGDAGVSIALISSCQAPKPFIENTQLEVSTPP
jgi:hypothetical protein